MAEKRYSKYRRKPPKKQRNTDDKTEKTVARVYACIILCLMAFTLSKVQSDYGAVLRQKIKVAINSDISIEKAEELLQVWSRKIDFIDEDIKIFDKESEI
ncbi:MAG: hypothetical protein IKU80_01815 [Firmicutes bacterium]|nr:hypothetical protein [Bacillota bacterium]